MKNCWKQNASSSNNSCTNYNRRGNKMRPAAIYHAAGLAFILQQLLYHLDFKNTYYYEPGSIALIGLLLRRTFHRQSRISGILNYF
jgi:hypothetical protein